ncbi:hypothetical protein HMPREF1508_1259 [Shuttleworthella sp. MSX8B]|nr:hypothetical protein HMPREF1508_1259 [Shuttleworthia sp. MSX8B]
MGFFIYKPGISVTKHHLSFAIRESPLTNGILKLHFISILFASIVN